MIRQLLWYPVNWTLGVVDFFYRRLMHLQPVGPLLYIKPLRYAGPARKLASGQVLLPGDPVGELHFNNTGLAEAQRRGKNSGFVFARLMMDALHQLASAVQKDPKLGQLVGFQGVTWIPAHGQRVGFEAQPLPDNWRTRLLSGYFRLLLFAFNPASSKRMRGRLQPSLFFLSRERLLQEFASEQVPDAQ